MIASDNDSRNPPSATRGKTRVLIIDDDPQFRRLTGEILRSHGWRVREAGEGDAGIEDVRKQRPDVVLCDLLMPRGNGFQVCRAIRADVTLRHTKIAVTSGRDYEAAKRRRNVCFREHARRRDALLP